MSVAWIWGKMTSFTTTYLYIYKCPANETTVRQNSLTPMPLIFVKNSVIHSAIEKHCYEIEEACRCTTSSDIWEHHGEEIIQMIMNIYIYIYIYIYRGCVYTARDIFLDTLRPKKIGHNFADAIFKCIFVNGNLIFTRISLEFVPMDQIDNMSVSI